MESALLGIRRACSRRTSRCRLGRLALVGDPLWRLDVKRVVISIRPLTRNSTVDRARGATTSGCTVEM